jgi:RNA polymerase sigma-70 factor (ECF subfamily)
MTQWKDVSAAGQSDSAMGVEAREKLCKSYSNPIYSFLRHWGHDCHQAQDLTQGFFLYLIEKNLFRTADQAKGRFRSFLLASLKNFVSNERQREGARKRGGGATILSLDAEMAEHKYGSEPVDHLTPDQIFDRKWAEEIMEKAMALFQMERERRKSAFNFNHLKPYLSGAAELSLVDLAKTLNCSYGALRAELSRLRRRYQHHIKEVIRMTVSDDSQVDEEFEHLKAIYMGR